LQAQIAGQLRAAIEEGRLPPGAKLPSTRAAAREFGVSRNVVLAAYEELFAEGYVEGVHGSGTYVRNDMPPMPKIRQRLRSRTPEQDAAGPQYGNTLGARGGHEEARQGRGPLDLRIYPGEVEPLPMKVWKRMWLKVSSKPPPNRYLDPDGDPDLRGQIAAYLGRARGVRCEAEDVVVTSGSQHALELVIRATVRAGDRAAIEDPGYPRACAALLGAGADLVPVPVDAEGLRVDLLPEGRRAPRLVYVTPSHQYPLGGRLPVPRRLALMEWAATNGALIVEDDYDGEFRYGAPPLPALAAQRDQASVAYIGTFSKILSPAFRVGYLVAPPVLRERVRALRASSDWHTSWPLQPALAHFMASGDFDRYVRRMRRLYSKKRSALAEVLGSAPEIGTLEGIEAGLHVFWRLDPVLDVRGVARSAARIGVLVSTPDEFYAGMPPVEGLMIGYGGPRVAELARGAERLLEATRRSKRGDHPLSRREPRPRSFAS